MTGLSWWRRHLTAWADRLRPSDVRYRTDLAEVLTIYRQVLDQRRAADCSCPGATVVVMHQRGTPCGLAQWTAIDTAASDAVDTSGWNTSTYPAAIAVAVEGVMDHLLNDRHYPKETP